VKDEVNKYRIELKEKSGVEIKQIISGGCIGVDTLPEKYAAEYNLTMIIKQPDWKMYPSNKYAFKAYLERDKQIASECDYMIAFPSSKGNGTQYTMQYAQNQCNKPVKIVRLNDR